jgi:hypothetical protein
MRAAGRLFTSARAQGSDLPYYLAQFCYSDPIACINHAEPPLDEAMNISDSISQAAHVFI